MFRLYAAIVVRWLRAGLTVVRRDKVFFEAVGCTMTAAQYNATHNNDFDSDYDGFCYQGSTLDANTFNGGS